MMWARTSSDVVLVGKTRSGLYFYGASLDSNKSLHSAFIHLHLVS